jgi:hypothetical protein
MRKNLRKLTCPLARCLLVLYLGRDINIRNQRLLVPSPSNDDITSLRHNYLKRAFLASRCEHLIM